MTTAWQHPPIFKLRPKPDRYLWRLGCESPQRAASRSVKRANGRHRMRTGDRCGVAAGRDEGGLRTALSGSRMV